MSKLFIAGHQGLGDHILCNGLYRELAKKHKLCVLAVKIVNFRSLKRMLGDQRNILIIPIPDKKVSFFLEKLQQFFNLFGFKCLKLGYKGENFLRGDIRFDENFYLQAKVDFIKRWESFSYFRNQELEMKLFKELECDREPYIFVHEDLRRGFLIDKKLIKSNIRIITPLPKTKKLNFFDYRFILESASEVHCIESSFCAFVESLQIPVKKFAHMYARPEASNDFCHEFTYKSNWTIFK